MLMGGPVSLGLRANEVQVKIEFSKSVSYLCPQANTIGHRPCLESQQLLAGM